MAYDVDRLLELIHCYTGSMIEAQIAADEIDRQQKRKKDALDAADRDWRGIMDMLAEAGTELEAARAEREQIEADRAECGRVKMPEEASEAAALHTCGECRYLQMGTKNGRPQGFCMHIGPEPVVDCDDDAVACSKFEPSIAKLAAVAPVPSLYTHTCGECRYWEEERDGTGTCMHRDCETKKRGEMDLSCLNFDKRTLALVSCLECKHVERVSDDINTWKCALGAGFAGYVKCECSRYEAL